LPLLADGYGFSLVLHQHNKARRHVWTCQAADNSKMIAMMAKFWTGMGVMNDSEMTKSRSSGHFDVFFAATK